MGLVSLSFDLDLSSKSGWLRRMSPKLLAVSKRKLFNTGVIHGLSILLSRFPGWLGLELDSQGANTILANLAFVRRCCLPTDMASEIVQLQERFLLATVLIDRRLGVLDDASAGL